MDRTSRFLAVFLITFLLFSGSVSAQKKQEGAEKFRPVMWEPVDVSKRDLFLGPGGEKLRPDLSRITFIKEEKGGGSKKYRIRDGKEREWVAKIGREAQPETVSVRLLWALGYKTEVNYLVPELKIPGQGEFKNVRLEARPENIEREGRWNWKENPFTGTKELQGLKVLMVFLNNWDLKSEGNNIRLLVDTGNRREIHYAISDLGATFGRTGYFNLPIFWRFGRSVNRPEAYRKSDFIARVEKGRIKFDYAGRNPDLFGDVTVGQARWVTELLLQLTDRQIKDAFRAANYSPVEIKLLTNTVKARISELDRATAGALAD